MSTLANGKTYRGDNGRVGWRALCATLGYAGPRISCSPALRRRFAAATPVEPERPFSAPQGDTLGRGQRSRRDARRGRSPRQREAHRGVPFEQSQVGHTHSKLTMDAYAQLLDRSKRSHGAAFDALLADAQETLYGARSGEFSPLLSPPGDFGRSADITPSPEIGSDTGESDDGRGGFRTCDLSRVKRALSH
jgi:hypothetical protein